MADALVGKWQYQAVDNLEAYMDAMGVPQQMREKAKDTHPEAEISKSGNIWTIKTTVGDKITETNYPEGEEVEAVNLLGKPMKAKLCVEGSSLVETQTMDDVTAVIVRSIEDGIYTVKMTVKGVTATATFTKA